MSHRLKISHHKHTGKLRPHEYTSYLPLALLLVITGVALIVSSVSAATAHPDPLSGSIGITGTMPAPPPTVAGTILAPAKQQHITVSPVTVSGTCPSGTLVELYKNDIFAGAGPCSSKGTFSYQIDLLFGQNILIAKVYDVLNQPGPDSTSVTVFYDVLPQQSAVLTSLSFGGSTQVIIMTDAAYRGVFPEHALSVPINITGGTPPYAVNVLWGDASNKVVSQNDNTSFNVSHTYTKPGVYQLSIQATDSKGRVAFLSVAVFVNGQPGIAATSSSTKPPTSKLVLLWPLYTGSIAVVISFWLGEKREKQLLLGSSLSLRA